MDRQCIDCDLCRQMVPDIFKRNWAGDCSHSYVARQPVSEGETALCNDALDACPVQAIGCCAKIEEAVA